MLVSQQLSNNLARNKDVFSLPERSVTVWTDVIDLINLSYRGEHTATETNLVCCCSFITSQNPNFAACLFKVDNAGLNIVLKQVLDTCDAKHGQARLHLLNFEFFDLVLGHVRHFLVGIN